MKRTRRREGGDKGIVEIAGESLTGAVGREWRRGEGVEKREKGEKGERGGKGEGRREISIYNLIICTSRSTRFTSHINLLLPVFVSTCVEGGGCTFVCVYLLLLLLCSLIGCYFFWLIGCLLYFWVNWVFVS